MKRPAFFKNQKGQASMEFLLVSTTLIFFIIFFITLSIVFMVSSYLDYSVFMASRAGVPSASDPQLQTENLKRSLASYLRSDGASNIANIDTDSTFFYPFVKLDTASGALQLDIMPRGRMLDPEFSGNVPAAESRLERLLLPFSHKFYLGAFFLPDMENLDELHGAGVIHIFRREPSVNECVETMKAMIQSTWGTSGVNVNDVGNLVDNGC